MPDLELTTKRAAREWRWQNPQVAQRAPRSLPQQFPLGRAVEFTGDEYRELRRRNVENREMKLA